MCNAIDVQAKLRGTAVEWRIYYPTVERSNQSHHPPTAMPRPSRHASCTFASFASGNGKDESLDDIDLSTPISCTVYLDMRLYAS